MGVVAIAQLAETGVLLPHFTGHFNRATDELKATDSRPCQANQGCIQDMNAALTNEALPYQGTTVRPDAVSLIGVMSGYTVPTLTITPSGIAIGPDERVWFTMYSTNQMGAFAPPKS